MNWIEELKPFLIAIIGTFIGCSVALPLLLGLARLLGLYAILLRPPLGLDR
jgi:ABC-type phosphate/phosphonate transport system permease subunit